ncbi:MAG TPA: hypothetical protein PLK31_03190 [Chloroflexota bacterium]|nr:hypothetical protein [Chloroflexota bacterium]
MDIVVSHWLSTGHPLSGLDIGGLTLLWLAWAAMQVWRQLWPTLAEKEWLVGLTLVLMWPLLWAALSGMETMLFATLGMQVILLYLRQVAVGQSLISNLRSLVFLGFFSGLLILTRPEGVVLVALVLLGLALPGDWRGRGKRVLVVGGTAVLLLLPYFLFNYWANGSLWPNTMAAKQTEYGVLLAQFIGWRLAQLLWLSLGGPDNGWQGMSSAHLLLLPGLLFAAWQAVKADWMNRQLARVLPLLWAGGHVLLYAWKLPVTYQHGRYLLGVMPVWILYGLAGWLLLLFVRQGGRGLWLAQKVAQFPFAFVLLFSCCKGRWRMLPMWPSLKERWWRWDAGWQRTHPPMRWWRRMILGRLAILRNGRCLIWRVSLHRKSFRCWLMKRPCLRMCWAVRQIIW